MKSKVFRVLIALVLALSFSMVMAAPAAADTLEVGSGKTYTTIQAAIDVAGSGDTIVVDAGTYTEDLTVNIANLTIQSVDGAATTIIQLVDGVGIDIQGGASGFILGGVEDEGFTIQSSSGAGTTFNIQLANAPSDVTISYNTIDTTGGASMGVSVGAAGATGLTISNNTFTGDDTPDGSIWGPDVVDVTVTNNVFTGLDLVSYGVQFDGISGTSVINGNTVTDYKGAGAIVILSGTGVSGLTINDNTISGCANGIRFYDDSGTGDITTVTVTENTLTDNAKAIRIGNGAHIVASDFVIEDNNISGSTSYGLQNEHSSEVVTAENNWWGNASGPTHATNPSGTGDVVTDRVDFLPWLDAAYPGGSATGYPVYNSTTAEEYETIQEAIDDASAGDTISVAEGTYEENLVIGVQGLTLQAASSPVIDGGGNLGPGVHITAANVTFQGFTVTNFTCDPYAPPEYPSGAGIGAIYVVGDGAVISDNIIYNIRSTASPEELTDPDMWPAGLGIDVAANGVEVTNNTVYEVDSIGIRVRSDYEEAWPGDTLMSGILVEGNTVYSTANSGVLVAGNVDNVTIKGNEIYNSLAPTPYGLLVVAGASAEGVPNNVLIEGNTIYDSYGNVCLGSVTNITVTGNTITGAIPHYSDPNIKGKNIYIRDWTDVQTANVTITNNDILGADGYGVNIKGIAVDVSTITINFNNISGNTEYGVLNEIATDVDAINNWWGNASGPVPDPLPITSYESYGDKIEPLTDVDARPWLLAEVEAGVTPTTYEETLALKDVWTMVSVDKEVTTGTDWVGTTALAGTATIVAYKYTAGTGYTQVTLATQLTSVDACYVKTDGGGGVGINYSTGSPGVVTKDLGAGWNTISCAGETDAYKLLIQVRYVQIGEQEGVGITNLIGQANYNQFLDPSFNIPLVTDAEWTNISPGGIPVPLNAFDGYWVYLNAAKSFGVIPE